MKNIFSVILILLFIGVPCGTHAAKKDLTDNVTYNTPAKSFGAADDNDTELYGQAFSQNLIDIVALSPVANNLLGWNAGGTAIENKSTLTIGWQRYSSYDGTTVDAFKYRWDAGDPTASRDFSMVNIGSDALEWNWDQGAVISTGTYGPLEVPWDCTIKSSTLLLDQTGSMEVDIWVDSYANYPPTIADTITASALPTVSAGIKDQDETLTGWTVSLSKGDIVYFVVNSAATAEKATLSLKVDK